MSVQHLTAVLSLGSNMGDSQALIQRALCDFPGKVVACSDFYATAPWGGVEQDDFLNVTAIVSFVGTPQKLLAACQQLEQAAHRTREVRWGPRTLDVDIVDIEGFTADAPELTVPHPRAHLRRFVLEPWLAIDPTARLNGKPLGQWLDTLDDGEDNVTRLDARPELQAHQHDECQTAPQSAPLTEESS